MYTDMDRRTEENRDFTAGCKSLLTIMDTKKRSLVQ